MKWLIDNWSLLVVLVCGVVAVGVWLSKIASAPTSEQVARLKSWLLYAVTEAEKDLGGGTGVLKLRYVYDRFLDKFPTLATIISFEEFSNYVDEVLEYMRHLLETNDRLKDYVEGNQHERNSGN